MAASSVLWSNQLWQLRREAEPPRLALLTAGQATPAARARLDRALEALRQIRSLHLVAPIRVIEDGGRIGLELQDPGGDTLAQRLGSGRLTLTEAADALLGVALGLQALHERGLVHRALCPELVFVAPERTLLCPGEAVKLALDSSVTGLGVYVPARPPYVAPELLREGDASAASDNWGLGMLAFLVVAGRPPIEARDPFEFETALRRGLPPLPPEAPEPLREAYAGLARLRPGDRWTAAQAAEALRAVRDTAVVAPAGAPVQLTLRIRHERVAVALPALVGRADPGLGHPPDVDLTPFDPGLTVSRRHARIWLEAGALRLEDLGSLNGTFVDGRRVRVAELRPGSKVVFGVVQAEIEG